MLPDAPNSKWRRRLVKRSLLFMTALRDLALIPLGRAKPAIPFTVLADPCSVYFNFRIKPERLQDFERYINLAAGFPLCPIQCLQNEQAEYLLTLNVYEVSGMAVGKRAEWSTYVTDEQGKPRYMVLEARSSEYSMDPESIITPRGLVEHTMNDREIRTRVASNGGARFEAVIDRGPEAPRVGIYGDWIEANDYIYWRNGVCDRTYYGAGLANARVRQFDAGAVRLDDATHWAEFVEPAPLHILQIEDPLDFLIVMWSNL